MIFYLMNSKDYQKLSENIVAEENHVENEMEVDTVANILNTVVSANNTSSNLAVNTTDANSRKVMNEELIVLYDGLILDTTKMDQVELKYIDNTSSDKDKYVITYYNYENFGYVDSTLGKLSDQVYDNLLKIENISRIAISEEYNAIPKDIKVINTLPTVISNNNPKLVEYNSVKTTIADLDMNGTDEYITILANKTTGYSKISLYDSTGNLIADLAYIEKSRWNQDTNAEYYLSLDNVNIIDIDNDGTMEILIEIPRFEGEPSVSILKYKNNELKGKTNIECSLLP